MFWNACSTLDASNAEVSIKERLFSAVGIERISYQRVSPPQAEHFKEYAVLPTSKCLGLLCRDSAEVPQIALVADEHDDNVTVGVVSELLQPAADIDVCGVLSDIVDE